MLTAAAACIFGCLRRPGAGPGRERRRRFPKRPSRTLAVLESTLAVEKPDIVKDQIVDIRKQELFSAVPWINRWLLKLELAPRLSRLLYQANLKWTAGALILMSVGCFAVPGYLFYLRTRGVILSLLIGPAAGKRAVLCMCSTSARSGSASLKKNCPRHST